MYRHTDVLIIGAGQAGLAMSQCLTQRSVEHVVLERGRVGERWLSERRPRQRLLTPNWMMRLPGAVPPPAPDGFMPVQDFAAYLDDYRCRIGAPVASGCEVRELRRDGDLFRLSTSFGDWSARTVVIATGACDRPAVPDWAGALPARVAQVPATRYRSAADLPDGPVLVIGASATGIQLAAEIRASGREVTLAVGRHVRTPRRYRGRDLFAWLDASGFLTDPRAPTMDGRNLRSQSSLQLVGNDIGQDISLDSLARDGVRIAGRALGVAGGHVRFDRNLSDDRIAAERRRHTLLSRIDSFVAEHCPEVPAEVAAWEPPQEIGPGPASIGLGTLGSVVWATGYRRSYPWLNLPVLDARGEIRCNLGVTPDPGLFVLGLPFMRHRTSAFIDGVGRDAEALAPAILNQLTQHNLLAA